MLSSQELDQVLMYTPNPNEPQSPPSLPATTPYCSTLETTQTAGIVFRNTGIEVTFNRDGTPENPEPHISVAGLTSVGGGDDGLSHCSARLCRWNALGVLSTNLASADEDLLISDTEPADVPDRLYEACGTLPGERVSCFGRLRKLDGSPCSRDEECPANAQCFVERQTGTSPFTGTCWEMGDVPACLAEAESLGREDCYTVTECERPEDALTAADTKLQCLAEAGRVPCDSLSFAAQFREQIVAPRPPALEQGYAPEITAPLDDLNIPVTEICLPTVPEESWGRVNALGAPGESNSSKAWGLSMNSGMGVFYGAEPGPFGIVLPTARAFANLELIGKVMGQSVPVLALDGGAVASAPGAQLYSTASLKLFGQDIAALKAGSNLEESFFDASLNREVSPSALLQVVNSEAGRVGGMAKAYLAMITRFYNRAVRAPENGNEVSDVLTPQTATVTRELCKLIMQRPTTYEGEAFPPAHAVELAERYDHLEMRNNQLAVVGFSGEVRVDPICDAPLTAQTATFLMNRLNAFYRNAVEGIPDDLDLVFSPTRLRLGYSPWADLNTIMNNRRADPQHSDYFSRNVASGEDAGRGFYSNATVFDINENFSLVGAVVQFPIGPVALVLDIQGTGSWGLEGGITYGLKYDGRKMLQEGDVPLEAEATATVAPTVDVGIDLFMGVGLDVGIAGASVGVNGQLTLVKVGGELGGGATLKIRNAGTRKLDAGDLADRIWPPELANLSPARDILAPEITLSRFEAAVHGNAHGGLTVAALAGELSLALRIRVLFFKKTWKKRIASMAGVETHYSFVEEGGAAIPLPPLPQFDVYPAIPFPEIADFTLDQFQGLADGWPGVTLPANPNTQEMQDALLSQADYFTDTWLPGIDPWLHRNEHPLGSERIQQAVNDAVESAPTSSELNPSCNLSFE